ncbi:copper chaperone PCu(A)C [Thioclava pacifica]|uniref:Copper-binding protein n=1 Tax=Thioclava pacifica DSM 10166 TaxID=1353537 RepID=A0A074J951_9RHOB|nr:copper chaperone PCu(A)C [Thioclava pacifica]KEO53069.1 hypothetical protein TP2_09010 [Thioclava pacifica DSM 10166]
MIRKFLMLAAACTIAMPAFADEIEIVDAYVRSSSPVSKSAAAFMDIRNTTDRDDRLVSASSDIAARVELHTHQVGPNGEMQMREVKGGFPVPAHGEHLLARGGDHVMMMGLRHPIHQGDLVRLTLVFEKAGTMVLDVPVDLERGQDMMQDDPVTHGEISHGGMTHGEITHGDPQLNKSESDM